MSKQDKVFLVFGSTAMVLSIFFALVTSNIQGVFASWDSANPVGTDNFAVSDDNIRNNFLAIEAGNANVAGTQNSTFWIDSDDTGFKIKNNANVCEIRDSTDAAYGDLTAANLTASGNLTTANATVSSNLTVSGTLTANSVMLSGNNALSDYFDSSTITGWTAPSGYLYTKRLGNTVFVYYSLTGTSNATTTSCTMPYNATDTEPTGMATGIASDAGASYVAALSVVTPGTQTLRFFKNMSDENTWTASGTKAVQGCLF